MLVARLLKIQPLSAFLLEQTAFLPYYVSNIMSEPFLKVTNLVRHFGAVKAVDGISFELKPGQSVGLIGANGAGKTTTMRLLTTLDLPDSGEIFFKGMDATVWPEKVRACIGWMPDGFDPPEHTTVYDFIDFFARAYGLSGEKRVIEVERVIKFCGIAELRDRHVKRLSKGQTQRVSLARMLIGNPDFLVMDEPAAGLDPQARLEFKQLVRELQKQGKTLLISSHILTELAEMCDYLIFMDSGRVIRTGSKSDLTGEQESNRPYSLRPLGDPNELLAWLAGSRDWMGATLQPDGSVHVDCLAKTDAEMVEALRALCNGNELLEISRRSINLEQTFVNILQENK